MEEQYKKIPDNTTIIGIMYTGGYCCEICNESWSGVGIYVKLPSGRGKLIWESSIYDSSDSLYEVDVRELRNELETAFEHYGLDRDKILGYDSTNPIDWKFEKDLGEQ